MESEKPFDEHVTGRLNMLDNFGSGMGGEIIDGAIHRFPARKLHGVADQNFLIQRIGMVEIEGCPAFQGPFPQVDVIRIQREDSSVLKL